MKNNIKYNMKSLLDMCSINENVNLDNKGSLFPFVKWAGGKKSLLNSLIPNFPNEYGRYYEPFIGGGAVFLHIKRKNCVINDINKQLINAYTQIKNNSDALVQKIKDLDLAKCSKEYYYENRNKYNQKIKNNIFDVECAALMIWINKHCFNGLYRVNSNGLFNVPYNNKIDIASIDERNIKRISTFLNTGVDIRCMDFEEACSDVKKGDLVYFDSPYLPVSATAKFTDYTEMGFSFEDHKRLADLYKKLDSLGVFVILSNNDVELVYDLYSGFNIKNINVNRAINRDGKNRKGKEVIITNY